MLSCTGLCVGPITRPGESCQGFFACDREASIRRQPWPTRGCWAMGKKINLCVLVKIAACYFCLIVAFSVLMIDYNAWGELLIEKIDCSLQFLLVNEVPCNVQEIVNAQPLKDEAQAAVFKDPVRTAQ